MGLTISLLGGLKLKEKLPSHQIERVRQQQSPRSPEDFLTEILQQIPA